jgi:hypothetical protein
MIMVSAEQLAAMVEAQVNAKLNPPPPPDEDHDQRLARLAKERERWMWEGPIRTHDLSKEKIEHPYNVIRTPPTTEVEDRGWAFVRSSNCKEAIMVAHGC